VKPTAPEGLDREPQAVRFPIAACVPTLSIRANLCSLRRNVNTGSYLVLPSKHSNHQANTYQNNDNQFCSFNLSAYMS
jgi:hypothetical protein